MVVSALHRYKKKKTQKNTRDRKDRDNKFRQKKNRHVKWRKKTKQKETIRQQWQSKQKKVGPKINRTKSAIDSFRLFRNDVIAPPLKTEQEWGHQLKERERQSNKNKDLVKNCKGHYSCLKWLTRNIFNYASLGKHKRLTDPLLGELRLPSLWAQAISSRQTLIILSSNNKAKTQAGREMRTRKVSIVSAQVPSLVHGTRVTCWCCIHGSQGYNSDTRRILAPIMHAQDSHVTWECQSPRHTRTCTHTWSTCDYPWILISVVWHFLPAFMLQLLPGLNQPQSSSWWTYTTCCSRTIL